ncbi:MAG TPA: hypothetical protein PK845_06855, partial [Petrotogaceae bacterium]|nr:hypothetical protein [Petrotogaceae bacterium]
MSIQNIKLVLEHIDYSNHCQRIRSDITRLNSWLIDPRTLNERKMYLFYRTTGRNIEKKFISKHINDFQFLLMHIIKNPNSSRFNDLKNYYKLTDDELQTIKFLLYPKKFAPGGFNTDLKRYNIEFYSADAVLKKLGFKDYIDLYALMKFVPY